MGSTMRAEGEVAAQMQPPTSHLLADRLAGVVAHRRREPDEEPTGPGPDRPLTERVAQEVEPLVLVRAGTVLALAVHDARLVRMQLQTDLRHPTGDGLKHVSCLGLAWAVNHRVVRVALEADEGKLLRQPGVERVVEEQV